MTCCDNCYRSYHLCCLDDLENLDEDEWHCPHCNFTKDFNSYLQRAGVLFQLKDPLSFLTLNKRINKIKHQYTTTLNKLQINYALTPHWTPLVKNGHPLASLATAPLGSNGSAVEPPKEVLEGETAELSDGGAAPLTSEETLKSRDSKSRRKTGRLMCMDRRRLSDTWECFESSSESEGEKKGK